MHRGTTAGWLVLGGLVLAGGVALALQQQEAMRLRHELELAREENREATRRRTEGGLVAAGQGTAGELTALRSDREALGRLREEIERLKTRMQAVQPAAARDAAAATPRAATLELTPATAWKNMGRATPKTALETALWAAVGGDIEALADTISLDAGARAKAAAILAGLPEPARAYYGSPEKLVALFTAKDVPVGSNMRMVTRAGATADEAKLTLVLQGETATRSIELALRRQDGAWRLVVPEAAVEKYGAMLKGDPAVAGGAR